MTRNPILSYLLGEIERDEFLRQFEGENNR
jgi:hypothetical protein